MLLEQFAVQLDKKPVELPHFPTRLQAVVWRNWGFVPVKRLAKMLEATESQIMELARDLGLETPPKVDELWLERGFITIIRANWHLLPYEQLLELLDWTPDRLAFALKEDDFLWHKMGNLKPNVEPVRYRELTAEDRLKTEQWRNRMNHYFPEGKLEEAEKPFGFLDRFSRPASITEVKGPIWDTSSELPGEEEIALNPGWTIVCPKDGRARLFAERFAAKQEARWGFRLPVSVESASEPSSPASPAIRLSVVSDESLLAESHRIEIAADEIRVTAVDEVGLLRGLQWLSSEMERRNAPFVQLGEVTRKTRFDLRYIYSYFAVYGDPLLDPDLDSYPDRLFEELSEIGVNGVWLQCILYQLVPFEAAPELSEYWEQRLEGLRRLVDRAADYGIGIYLYYNEPRSMPFSFFEKKPEWKGHADSIHATLCTSHPEVQQYLKDSTARLFQEVPGLAGLFTITMSENMTNCFSRAPQGNTNCPRCSQRTPHEVAAEVNRIIAEGAHSTNPKARIICWTWGWTAGLGWSQENVEEGIRLLPDGVSLMCVSEDELTTEIGGVRGLLKDYSISNVGPSEKSIVSWKAAKERGLSAVAKVQLNNTWECSAVPYLPVHDLISEHLNRLQHSGVTGLMLSWTLGGYPSYNLELASRYYWEQDVRKPSEGELLAGRFGAEAGQAVQQAARCFSDAFREFPFHISTAYTAPQNFGPSNLLYAVPTGYKATMIGFPYDSLDSWRSIYPPDIFENQFRLLSEGWRKGLELLTDFVEQNEAQKAAYQEFRLVAEAAYCHFRSTYLQVAFVRRRNEMLESEDGERREATRRSLLEILDEEIQIAQTLHRIATLDSRIGYEATNHYFYTSRDLQEKVMNGLYLREMFQ